MKSNRRDFLRIATAAGAGTFTSGLLSGCTPKQPESNLASILESVKKTHIQKFNMSGYAAPAIPLVRVGIIGLGDRGSDAVQRLSYIDGLEIRALYLHTLDPAYTNFTLCNGKWKARCK